MQLYFLKPNGENPSLKARVALQVADPLMANVAIGGIALWIGDGTRGHAKGELSVTYPKFGVISGRPSKIVGVDEDGNETVRYEPAQSGVKDMARIGAAIVTTFRSLEDRGADPFVGRHDLDLSTKIVGSDPLQEKARIMEEELIALRAELDRLTTPDEATA
jgi:hypothetical protein